MPYSGLLEWHGKGSWAVIDQEQPPPPPPPELQHHPGDVLEWQWWRWGEYIAGFRTRERAELHGSRNGWPS